jgi:hypothetical protein
METVPTERIKWSVRVGVDELIFLGEGFKRQWFLAFESNEFALRMMIGMG